MLVIHPQYHIWHRLHNSYSILQSFGIWEQLPPFDSDGSWLPFETKEKVFNLNWCYLQTYCLITCLSSTVTHEYAHNVKIDLEMPSGLRNALIYFIILIKDEQVFVTKKNLWPVSFCYVLDFIIQVLRLCKCTVCCLCTGDFGTADGTEE